VRSDLFTSRTAAETLVTDFFGGVAQVQVVDEVENDSAVAAAPIQQTPSLSSDTKRRPAIFATGRETHAVSRPRSDHDRQPRTTGTDIRAWVAVVGLACLVAWSIRTSSSA